jgi:long-chain acyl-CoA synthetase
VSNAAARLLARCEGRQPVLLIGSRTVSADELQHEVERAARSAQAAAAPGERIGVLADNGLEFVAAYLGILKVGRVVVPLPAKTEPAELRTLAGRTQMRGVFCDARSRPTVLAADQVELQPSDGAPVPAVELEAATLAAIMLTSGSTGDAKGVMVSHGNIDANTADIVGYLGLSSADRAMLVLPLSYCFGLSLLHTHLLAGGSLVLNNAFLFIERVLDEMEATACSGFAGVPANYQMLLQRSSFVRRPWLALRWLQQAGGKLPDAQIEEIRAALPAVSFFVMYGQTEATARLSYLPPERLTAKLGSIGRGLPSTSLTVERADGTAVSPGSDEIGEVIASGPGIAAGYWNDPEETARYFRAGRLFTGDMARVDADGFIFLVDRARDFIKVMGVRLSPLEIETLIGALPQVAEVAVVGVPDAESGEAIIAAVVCADGFACDGDAIRQYCNERLPNVKVPKRVVVLEALPRTSSGKVRKQALRELVA